MGSMKSRSRLVAGLAFVAMFALVTALLPERTRERSQSLNPARVAAGEAEAPESLPVPQAAPAPKEEQNSKQRSALVTREVVEPTPSAAPPAKQLAPLGAVIYGSVQSSGTREFSYCFVVLERPGEERLSVRVPKDGNYSIGPLPAGEHQLQCSASDHHTQTLPVTIAEGESSVRQDFVLRMQQVVAINLVTSRGDPALPALAEAGISTFGSQLIPIATRDDPGETFEGISGSPNNSYGIGMFWGAGFSGRPVLGPTQYGTVTLFEDGPAWVSLIASGQVLGKQQITPETVEVEFVVDPEDFTALRCSFTARLVAAESGLPLAASIHVGNDPFFNGRRTAVGEDGVISMTDQDPGRRYLVVKAEGRAQLVRPLDLKPGAALDLGDIELHRPIELSGHVRQENGAPFESVLRWGLLDPATGSARWVRQRSALSSPDGSFALKDLEPGIWFVQALGERGRAPSQPARKLLSLAQRFDATEGSITDIELTLLKTSTVTFVVSGAADPWPSVRAFDLRGFPAGATWLGRYGPESEIRLPPGAYELVIKRDGEEVERRNLSVSDQGQRLELSFD